MSYKETFEDPISIPQYFMTDEIFEMACENLETDEELGQFFYLISSWALTNIFDEEKAVQCSTNVIDAVNRAVAILFSGLNKYRWDYMNGNKGGRPKRYIPQLKKI